MREIPCNDYFRSKHGRFASSAAAGVQKAGLDSEAHVFICHHLALAHSFPGFAIKPGLFGNLILFLALFFMLVYQASAIRSQVSAEMV